MDKITTKKPNPKHRLYWCFIEFIWRTIIHVVFLTGFVTFSLVTSPPSRLAISTKKLFRGRQYRRNNWFVPAESGCSAEQKTLGIPFRTIPQRRKQLGIAFRETNKEKKKTLEILFQSIPRKRNQLGIPFRTSVEQK
jgi:hypothetical protein